MENFSKKTDETSENSKTNIDTEPFEQPELNDVLCGKDKTYGIHPGNQKFRAMIDSFAEVYKGNHSKQDKMKITRTIVTAMKQRYNTRFIKRVKLNEIDMWEQISDAIARDKVSHALRFAANMKKGRTSVCAKKLDENCRENDNPAKQTQKRSRGNLLQACETEHNGGHHNLLEYTQTNITGFQQYLRKDALLGGMGCSSQDFDAQYVSRESLLLFQRSTSNESRDGYFTDIDLTPLNDPYRQPFLQQQTSIGNFEALLNSMRSEDLQILMHEDMEKDWV